MDKKINPAPLGQISKVCGIKIIFFGTPEFAQIVLQKLIGQADFEIAAVVTAPDKPMGRKQILTPPPVKALAQENSIPVLQPAILDNEFSAALKKYNADLFVVAAYGQIMPKNILDTPKHGSLNVHPSLLPKYRGASPIQAAILNGDEETGVTIIIMDEKMDHGAILAKLKTQSRVLGTEHKVFKELHNELAYLGAELLVKTILDFMAGKIQPVPQEHEQATFCKRVKKQDGEIDWHNSAEKIYNQWRAYYEWPGVYSTQNTINNKQGIKIKFIEFAVPSASARRLGERMSEGEFFVKDKKLYITCGDGNMLEIKKLQPEGKNIMDAGSFINGYLI